jgi:hypothetical protein
MRSIVRSMWRAAAPAACAGLCLMWITPVRASGVDALLACRKIAASAERLACFDRESAALTPAAVAPAAHAGARRAAPPTPVAAAAGLSPQQTFGMAPMQVLAREQAARKAPQALDRLSAHIAALGRAADGREIFTLDNHQVWSQLEPDAELGARAGDAVTISRGWLGSYWLSLESRHGCKVTRIR